MLLGLGAVPALADVSAACKNREDPVRMEQACSADIRNSATSDYDRGVAYLYRCQAIDMQGRPEEALADCLAAKDANPDDSSIYNSLTIIYLNLNQPERALAAAQRGVDLKPEDGDYVNGRANARCAMGLYEGSYKDRLRALELGRFTAKGLQNAMRSRGYYKGPVDGKFGPSSRSAVQAWTNAGCP